MKNIFYAAFVLLVVFASGYLTRCATAPDAPPCPELPDLSGRLDSLRALLRDRDRARDSLLSELNQQTRHDSIIYVYRRQHVDTMPAGELQAWWDERYSVAEK